MFAGFNFKIDKDFFEWQEKTFEEYQRIGESYLYSQNKGIKNTLEKYINNDIVDGTKIHIV